ncbi:CoB--CoM heterodisulfide reductase iron-sulfur subunit B family protein [Xylanibacter oryzae]|uniref:CoB--CoM heterodisulfide reductase iron-sulfur subunit B family protein n=1 Tax=Xylanibacter oryzae TaxID=185293 RepID=UPI0004B3AFF7|nr:CoB--CoM heterodisulfide reductase iron-sulfur subunit B family protein [Xylanibacter oryzae]
MKLGFYPGCSLNGTAREYNESVKALAPVFGIELIDIDDWNCCGASAAHAVNRDLSLALPARTLALAEKQGFDEIVVPCAACFNRLAVAQYELNKDEMLKKSVEKSINMTFKNDIKILNVVQFIEKYIKDKIAEKVSHKFEHQVACYYGCLLVRPHKIIDFDRVEDPTSLDELMQLIGATPIDWGFKTECCGASLSIARTDLVAKLSGNIVKDAADRGAEAIIVACPMCQSNLDMRRPQIDKYVGKEISTPVIYITQAIGLAVGIAPEKLGLQRHFVKVNTL